MALPVEKLGTRYDSLTETIDPDRARAYAEATNDDNPAYESGKYAPPVFGVVPTWAAMGLAIADVVPADVMMMVVHGEEDVWFHRPLVPGLTITTTAEAHSIRVSGSGTRFTVKLASVDAGDGQPVLDIYNTLFIRGMSDGESAGPDKPDHTFPDDARDHRVGELSIHVDDDQTFRYRDASGDLMPIHTDHALAKSVGLPGIIAHGLCTMAMNSQAVIKTVADGDPARLKRLAVRFAKNVFPGHDVVTTIYRAASVDPTGTATPRQAYSFEATSEGNVVIAHGRAEIETSL